MKKISKILVIKASFLICILLCTQGVTADPPIQVDPDEGSINPEDLPKWNMTMPWPDENNTNNENDNGNETNSGPDQNQTGISEPVQEKHCPIRHWPIIEIFYRIFHEYEEVQFGGMRM